MMSFCLCVAVWLWFSKLRYWGDALDDQIGNHFMFLFLRPWRKQNQIIRKDDFFSRLAAFWRLNLLESWSIFEAGMVIKTPVDQQKHLMSWRICSFNKNSY